MTASSYDYLAPLLEAHKTGRWGKAERAGVEIFYYIALETLAQEQGLPFRRVKSTLPYYRDNSQTIYDAVVSAMVLYQGDQPILCDLHGNKTPLKVVNSFARHHALDIEIPKKLRAPEEWMDAPPRRYRNGSPSQSRLDAVINEGRAYLQAFYLEQTPVPVGVRTPGRRI